MDGVSLDRSRRRKVKGVAGEERGLNFANLQTAWPQSNFAKTTTTTKVEGE